MSILIYTWNFISVRKNMVQKRFLRSNIFKFTYETNYLYWCCEMGIKIIKELIL